MTGGYFHLLAFHTLHSSTTNFRKHEMQSDSKYPNDCMIARLSSTGKSRDCTRPVEDRHDKHDMLEPFTRQGKVN